MKYGSGALLLSCICFWLHSDNALVASVPVINGVAHPVPLSTYGGDSVDISVSQLQTTLSDEISVEYQSNFATYAAVSISILNGGQTVQCRTVPGAGSGFSWRVLVSSGSGVSMSAWFIRAGGTAYNTPVILQVRAGIFSVLGGSSMTLVGESFGPANTTSVNVSYYDSATPNVFKMWATGCTLTKAQGEIVCSAAPGVGQGLAFQVTANGQSGSSVPTSVKYAGPIVSSIAGWQLNTDGGSKITIIGTFLGPISVPSELISLTYGTAVGQEMTAKVATCVVTKAFIEITCTAAPGMGQSHVGLLTVSGQSGQLTGGIWYGFPAIASVSGPSLSTAGSTVVTLVGSNFGPVSSDPLWNALSATVTATYGVGGKYIASACAVVQLGRIECQAAAGSGKDHQWEVTVAGQQSAFSAASQTSSYTAPSIIGDITTAGGSSFIATTGGIVVIIEGQNFGPVGAPLVVTYGPAVNPAKYTAASCTQSVAHIRINCTTVAGVGSDLRWRVTVDGVQGNSYASTFSYLPPSISSVSSSGPLATTGGTSITLVGSNLGTEDIILEWYDPAFSLQRFISRCGGQSSHETRVCSVGAGVGAALVWMLTVGDQVTSFSSSLAYASPTLSEVSVDNPSGKLNTLGGETITVRGSHFGPVAVQYVHVSYGPAGNELEATNCRVSVADVEVRCSSVGGVNSGHRLKVSVASQFVLSPTSITLSYKFPSISSVQGTLLSTAGGTKVTLSGSDFGPLTESGIWNSLGASVTATYGGADGSLYEASNCQVTSDSQVLICSAAVGIGAQHRWRLKVGAQSSALSSSSQVSSYRAPSISTLSGAAMPTAGGSVVTVEGQDFGPANALVNPVTGTYGKVTGQEKSATNCAVTVSHTTITCNSVQGTGRGHYWRVTVGAQQSMRSNSTMDYAVPTISALSGALPLLSTLGGETVTLSGTNFGAVGSGATLQARYGNQVDYEYVASACIVTSDHVQMTCVSAQGVGAALRWDVALDGLRSARSSSTTAYLPPVITAVSFPAGTLSTLGRETVTITGQQFGPVSGHTVTGTYGPYTAACFVASAHTVVHCVTQQGVGKLHAWRLSVGRQTSGDSTDLTSYTPPTISSVYPHVVPVDGGTNVTVTGLNLGSPLEGSVGFFSCSWLYFTWNNPTQLICTLPSIAIPANESALVYPFVTTVGSQPSNALDLQYFYFYGLSPAFSNIKGGNPITFLGHGFSQNVPAGFPQVKILNAIDAKFNSTIGGKFVGSQLRFTSPAGFGPVASFKMETSVANVQLAMGPTWSGGPAHFISAPLTGGRLTWYNTTIASFSPASGPVGGATIIAVKGVFYPTGALLAKFGAVEAVAQTVSSSESTVIAPSWSFTGLTNMNLFISMDLDESSRVFASGPYDFIVYPTPHVLSLDPWLGPLEGGTVVTIHGSGFVRTSPRAGVPNEVKCSFGASWVVGYTENVGQETVVVCESPLLSEGQHAVEVALNGQQFTADGLLFTAYPHPLITTPSNPGVAPMSGGSHTLLMGAVFIESSYFRVGFFETLTAPSPVVYMEVTFLNSSTCRFLTPTLPAQFYDSKYSPDVSLYVTVSLNTQQYSPRQELSKLFVYQPPWVNSVSPKLGPLEGSTLVTVIGRFFDTGILLADFGPMLAESSPNGQATLGANRPLVSCAARPDLSAGLQSPLRAIVCVSPPQDIASNAEALSDPAGVLLRISVDREEVTKRTFSFTSSSGYFFYHSNVFDVQKEWEGTLALGLPTLAHFSVDLAQFALVTDWLGWRDFTMKLQASHISLSISAISELLPIPIENSGDELGGPITIEVQVNQLQVLIADGEIDAGCNRIFFLDAEQREHLSKCMFPETCGQDPTRFWVTLPRVPRGRSQFFLGLAQTGALPAVPSTYSSMLPDGLRELSCLHDEAPSLVLPSGTPSSPLKYAYSSNLLKAQGSMDWKTSPHIAVPIDWQGQGVAGVVVDGEWPAPPVTGAACPSNRAVWHLYFSSSPDAVYLPIHLQEDTPCEAAILPKDMETIAWDGCNIWHADSAKLSRKAFVCADTTTSLRIRISFSKLKGATSVTMEGCADSTEPAGNTLTFASSTQFNAGTLYVFVGVNYIVGANSTSPAVAPWLPVLHRLGVSQASSLHKHLAISPVQSDQKRRQTADIEFQAVAGPDALNRSARPLSISFNGQQWADTLTALQTLLLTDVQLMEIAPSFLSALFGGEVVIRGSGFPGSTAHGSFDPLGRQLADCSVELEHLIRCQVPPLSDPSIVSTSLSNPVAISFDWGQHWVNVSDLSFGWLRGFDFLLQPALISSGHTQLVTLHLKLHSSITAGALLPPLLNLSSFQLELLPPGALPALNFSSLPLYALNFTDVGTSSEGLALQFLLPGLPSQANLAWGLRLRVGKVQLSPAAGVPLEVVDVETWRLSPHCGPSLLQGFGLASPAAVTTARFSGQPGEIPFALAEKELQAKIRFLALIDPKAQESNGAFNTSNSSIALADNAVDEALVISAAFATRTAELVWTSPANGPGSIFFNAEYEWMDLQALYTHEELSIRLGIVPGDALTGLEVLAEALPSLLMLDFSISYAFCPECQGVLAAPLAAQRFHGLTLDAPFGGAINMSRAHVSAASDNRVWIRFDFSPLTWPKRESGDLVLSFKRVIRPPDEGPVGEAASLMLARTLDVRSQALLLGQAFPCHGSVQVNASRSVPALKVHTNRLELVGSPLGLAEGHYLVELALGQSAPGVSATFDAPSFFHTQAHFLPDPLSLTKELREIPDLHWVFTVYPPKVAVLSIIPDAADQRTVTTITLRGSNFDAISHLDHELPLVRWVVRLPDGALFHFIRGAAFERSQQKAGKVGMITSSSPVFQANFSFLVATVDLALNGQVYTSTSVPLLRTMTLFDSPVITSYGPRVSPMSGGTSLQLVASNIFFRSTKVICRFGSNASALSKFAQEVQAEFSSRNPYCQQECVLQCTIPPHPAGTVVVAISNNRGASWHSLTAKGSAALLTYQPCLPGWKSGDFQTPCTPCPPGKSPDQNQTYCVSCKLHTFSDEPGQPDCTTCPAHSITLKQGSSALTECLCRGPSRRGGIGFYKLDNTTLEPCLKCPANAICPGGWSVPQPIPGFFRDPNQLDLMRACVPVEACPGGEISQCEAQYDPAHFCQRCAQGYHRFFTRCVRCWPADRPHLLVSIQLLMQVVLLLVLYFQISIISKVGAMGIALGFIEMIFLFGFFPLQWDPGYRAAFVVVGSFLPFLFFPAWHMTAAVPCWKSKLMASILDPPLLFALPLFTPLLQLLVLVFIYMLDTLLITRCQDAWTRTRTPTGSPTKNPAEQSPKKVGRGKRKNADDKKESAKLAGKVGKFASKNDKRESANLLGESARPRKMPFSVSISKKSDKTPKVLKNIVEKTSKKSNNDPKKARLKSWPRFKASVLMVCVLDVSYLMLSATNVLACSQDGSKPGLCIPSNRFSYAGLLVVAAALIVPLWYLCNPMTRTKVSKDQYQLVSLFKRYRKGPWKRWELVIMARKLVVTTAVSGIVTTNPVLQAFMVVVVLSISLFLHIIVAPFKLAEANMLETICLVVELLFIFATLTFSMPEILDSRVEEYLYRFRLRFEKVRDKKALEGGNKKVQALETSEANEQLNHTSFIHLVTRLVMKTTREFIPETQVHSLLVNHSLFRSRLSEAGNDVRKAWVSDSTHARWPTLNKQAIEQAKQCLEKVKQAMKTGQGNDHLHSLLESLHGAWTDILQATTENTSLPVAMMRVVKVDSVRQRAAQLKAKIKNLMEALVALTREHRWLEELQLASLLQDGESQSPYLEWARNALQNVEMCMDEETFLQKPDGLIHWRANVGTTRRQWDNLAQGVRKLVHDFKLMVSAENCYVSHMCVKTPTPNVIRGSIVEGDAMLCMHKDIVQYEIRLRDKLGQHLRAVSKEIQISARISYLGPGSIVKKEAKHLEQKQKNEREQKQKNKRNSVQKVARGVVDLLAIKANRALRSVNAACKSHVAQPAVVGFEIPESLPEGKYKVTLSVNQLPLKDDQVRMLIRDQEGHIIMDKAVATRLLVQAPIQADQVQCRLMCGSVAQKQSMEVHESAKYVNKIQKKSMEVHESAANVNRIPRTDLAEGVTLWVTGPRKGGVYTAVLTKCTVEGSYVVTPAFADRSYCSLTDSGVTNKHGSCIAGSSSGYLQYRFKVNLIDIKPNIYNITLRLDHGEKPIASYFIETTNEEVDETTLKILPFSVPVKASMFCFNFECKEKESKGGGGGKGAPAPLSRLSAVVVFCTHGTRLVGPKYDLLPCKLSLSNPDECQFKAEFHPRKPGHYQLRITVHAAQDAERSQKEVEEGFGEDGWIRMTPKKYHKKPYAPVDWAKVKDGRYVSFLNRQERYDVPILSVASELADISEGEIKGARDFREAQAGKEKQVGAACFAQLRHPVSAGHTAPILCSYVHPRHRKLYTGSTSELRVWDLAYGKAERETKPKLAGATCMLVMELSISRDNKDEYELWDPNEGRMHLVQVLVAGQADGCISVYLIDPEEGVLVYTRQTVQGHKGWDVFQGLAQDSRRKDMFWSWVSTEDQKIRFDRDGRDEAIKAWTIEVVPRKIQDASLRDLRKASGHEILVWEEFLPQHFPCEGITCFYECQGHIVYSTESLDVRYIGPKHRRVPSPDHEFQVGPSPVTSLLLVPSEDGRSAEVVWAINGVDLYRKDLSSASGAHCRFPLDKAYESQHHLYPLKIDQTPTATCILLDSDVSFGSGKKQKASPQWQGEEDTVDRFVLVGTNLGLVFVLSASAKASNYHCLTAFQPLVDDSKYRGITSMALKRFNDGERELFCGYEDGTLASLKYRPRFGDLDSQTRGYLRGEKLETFVFKQKGKTAIRDIIWFQSIPAEKELRAKNKSKQERQLANLITVYDLEAKCWNAGDRINRSVSAVYRSATWIEVLRPFGTFVYDSLQLLSYAFVSGYYWPLSSPPAMVGGSLTLLNYKFDITDSDRLFQVIASAFFGMMLFLFCFVLYNPEPKAGFGGAAFIGSILASNYCKIISDYFVTPITTGIMYLFQCDTIKGAKDGVKYHNTLQDRHGQPMECYQGFHSVLCLSLLPLFVFWFFAARLKLVEGNMNRMAPTHEKQSMGAEESENLEQPVFKPLTIRRWLSVWLPPFKLDLRSFSGVYQTFSLKKQTVAYLFVAFFVRLLSSIFNMILEAHLQGTAQLFLQLLMLGVSLLKPPFISTFANSLNLAFQFLVMQSNLFAMAVLLVRDHREFISHAYTASFWIPILVGYTLGQSLFKENRQTQKPQYYYNQTRLKTQKETARTASSPDSIYVTASSRQGSQPTEPLPRREGQPFARTVSPHGINVAASSWPSSPPALHPLPRLEGQPPAQYKPSGGMPVPQVGVPYYEPLQQAGVPYYEPLHYEGQAPPRGMPYVLPLGAGNQIIPPLQQAGVPYYGQALPEMPYGLPLGAGKQIRPIAPPSLMDWQPGSENLPVLPPLEEGKSLILAPRTQERQREGKFQFPVVYYVQPEPSALMAAPGMLYVQPLGEAYSVAPQGKEQLYMPVAAPSMLYLEQEGAPVMPYLEAKHPPITAPAIPNLRAGEAINFEPDAPTPATLSPSEQNLQRSPGHGVSSLQRDSPNPTTSPPVQAEEQLDEAKVRASRI
eukprot:g79511.t1